MNVKDRTESKYPSIVFLSILILDISEDNLNRKQLFVTFLGQLRNDDHVWLYLRKILRQNVSEYDQVIPHTADKPTAP